MKIFLDVIGCRLNQSEVEGLGNTFRALGHEIVADASQADLAIVNTCAVTVKAAADSRKKLRRAGREGVPRVVATGCWATLYPQPALDLPGVTDVFTNTEKEGIASSITGIPQDKIDLFDQVREPLPGDRARTRAFIKVQEGCDNRCTYCLTRLARGRSRSQTLHKIMCDVDVALAGGVKELVLTGVQLGAWGKDLVPKNTLVDLLARLLSHGGFKRVRLSSIEPWDFDLSLLNYWSDERMCRHLHIPLQSGDNSILKAMGRPISVDDYRKLIEQIQTAIPGVAITTDMIAGFPGESKKAFQNSQEFVSSIGFAGGHVFTYSPRPGTQAVKRMDQIPVSTAKARNAALRRTFRNSGSEYRQDFLGKTMDVLWEFGTRTQNGLWQLSGLTDNYLRVYTESEDNHWNQISKVRIASEIPSKAALQGVLV
jgi:threonylcarbamoyladenosine tRNA methylthiotransferase MtaB